MSNDPAVTSPGRGRLLTAQTVVSVLLLIGAALLVLAATRADRIWGDWRLAQVGLVAAACLSVAAALAPWVVPGLSVAAQRRLIWVPVAVASAVVGLAVHVAHLSAFVAVQALLTAAVLAEVGTRRRALVWLVWTALALTAAVVLYYGLVSPRPGAD